MPLHDKRVNKRYKSRNHNPQINNHMKLLNMYFLAFVIEFPTKVLFDFSFYCLHMHQQSSCDFNITAVTEKSTQPLK